jgi:hypothetical protein
LINTTDPESREHSAPFTIAVAPVPPVDPIAVHAFDMGTGDGDGDVGVELVPLPPHATASNQLPAASFQLLRKPVLLKSWQLAAGSWRLAAGS